MLTRGVQLPSMDENTRKGGAGPTLGRYFLFNNSVVVNAPVRTGAHAQNYHSFELQHLSGNQYQISDFEGKPTDVTLVPAPQFYQSNLTDGTPMTQIALVHGVDCLATTIVQQCDYFSQGLECRYCSIPLSLELERTVLHKTPDQFLQVLQKAQQEGCAAHLTLTRGSPARPDRGAQDYVDFVTSIRQHSDVSIHVQLEPPGSIDDLRALKDAGVDTVGIHIEIYDDTLRKQYCPGKFQYASFDDYLQAWRDAVNLFGRGQVSTFILLGLGETAEQLHKGFKVTIETGAIPVPVPCRPNPGSHLEGHILKYVDNLDEIVSIYLDCARLLYDHQLDPRIHQAGCIRCTGCTALTEAYQVFKADIESKH